MDRLGALASRRHLLREELTMIGRRAAIGGFTTVMAASAFAGMVGPADAAQRLNDIKIPAPLRGPRMNFEQADKVMSELGLDAIVVGAGVNFYHATGMDLSETRMGLAPGVLAIVSR